MTKKLPFFLILIFLLSGAMGATAQQSVARQWNDMMLECIRRHQARPVVVARNLYHASILMYDGWAVYDDDASTVLLGQTLGTFDCPYQGMPIPEVIEDAQNEAISYAMYRFLTERYQDAPNNNWNNILKPLVDALMTDLGYDISVTSTNYLDGDPAKLGNYLAAQLQLYALSDGANQANNYANNFYEPVNGDIFPQLPGNPNCEDPNRWQPLSLTLQLDQNGFPVPNGQAALGHEWGEVVPFALTPDQKEIYQRDGFDWPVYLDPGAPPMHSNNGPTALEDDFFKWAYSVVAMWHSFHDPTDGVMVDISPNSLGNVNFNDLPESFEDYKEFYDPFEGGEDGPGYAINPATGQPYELQMVPRGDYTRVLSEYWADGPSSETPPGHWFKILNENVHDHPSFERRWQGQGPELSELEWDVRAYLALGGAIHDAAIACWSVKGFYDATRPLYAIRYMADLGQSTDPNLASYHPGGLPLVPGYIELVEIGDPLAGQNNANVGKLKLFTWRGPSAATGMDGVGWILAENWWTFQRHTFVTPPFAGYYSGHSTYSRTAAEVLAMMTGDEYFPGGLCEFVAEANQYLGATTGPSVDVHLQWAKYADAADQCSLSRIYGGLHPPHDDIPGRRVGRIVGPQAFNKADEIVNAGVPSVVQITSSHDAVGAVNVGQIFFYQFVFSEPMNTGVEPVLSFSNGTPVGPVLVPLDMFWVNSTTYRIRYIITDQNAAVLNTRVRVTDARDPDGNKNKPAYGAPITFDLQRPLLVSVTPSDVTVSDEEAMNGTFHLDIMYNEAMGTAIAPVINYTMNSPIGSLTFDAGSSSWINATTFRAMYSVSDLNTNINGIMFTVASARDASANNQIISAQNNIFNVDTRNPLAVSADANILLLTEVNTGDDVFEVFISFDESMDETIPATVIFSEDVAAAGLVLDAETSGWIAPNIYLARYDFTDADAELEGIIVESTMARDLAGNEQVNLILEGTIAIDTKNPVVDSGDFAAVINDEVANDGTYTIDLTYDELMDQSVNPVIVFTGNDPLVNTLTADAGQSMWLDAQVFRFVFQAADAGEELSGIGIEVSGALDAAGNPQELIYTSGNAILVDTRNPLATDALTSSYNITSADVGNDSFQIIVLFDEPMDMDVAPVIEFTDEDPSAVLTLSATSGWINPTAYRFNFDVSDEFVQIPDVDVLISSALDANGNFMEEMMLADFFDIHSVVGVEDEVFAELNLYPNPMRAGDIFYVTMPQFPADCVLRIFNAAGQLVQQEEPRTGANRISITTENWSAGTYTIHLSSERGNKAMRFVLN
jgi:hypothetical protein